MWLKIKIIFYILAGLIILGFIIYTEHLRAERATLRSELYISQQENASLKLEAEANEKALLAREEEIAVLSTEKEALLNDLDALYKTDKEAGEWGAATIPNGVISRLR